MEYSIKNGKLGRAVARGNYRLRLEMVLMAALTATVSFLVGGFPKRG